MLAALAVGSWACEKDEDRIVLQPGTSPELEASASSILLEEEKASEEALTLNWLRADFGYDAQINSTLLIKNRTQESYAEAMALDMGTGDSYTFTQASLNEIALEMGIEANNSGTLDMKIESSVSEFVDSVVSNEVSVEVTPYNQACPSIYVVGAGAVEAGWGWGSPVEFLCEENVYQATIALTNDTFRFFTTEGDWASGLNFPYYVEEGYTIDPAFEDAMDGDNNFRFLGQPGTYTLTVDDNAKTILLSPAEGENVYFLVGSAISASGWNWDNPTAFAVETESGVYKVKTEIVNGTGNENAFRFFTTFADWGSGLNFPYFTGEGYTIDSVLINAEDNDSNFKFTGETGVYTITIDTNDKVITIE